MTRQNQGCQSEQFDVLFREKMKIKSNQSDIWRGLDIHTFHIEINWYASSRIEDTHHITYLMQLWLGNTIPADLELWVV